MSALSSLYFPSMSILYMNASLGFAVSFLGFLSWVFLERGYERFSFPALSLFVLCCISFPYFDLVVVRSSIEHLLTNKVTKKFNYFVWCSDF
jgi:hypothetical protein